MNSMTMPTMSQIEQGKSPVEVFSEVRDILSKDTLSSNNLGSFVTTSIDAYAEKLLLSSYKKNFACKSEYPGIQKLHARCLSILAGLWGSPNQDEPTGTATTGSSESIFLAVLALKRAWQSRPPLLQQQQQQQQHETRGRLPNIVIGSYSHIAVYKAARTLDIEIRTVDACGKSNYTFDISKLEAVLDENTIGVVLTLGNTYTGSYDPVQEVAEALDCHQRLTGVDVPIHIDGASGAFVAPFTEGGSKSWGFPIPRVVSINASGHKFGMVPSSIGWILWRSPRHLPKAMKYQSSYLLGEDEGFSMSFSQSSVGVVLQYYNLEALGFQGFRRIVQESLQKALRLGRSLEETAWFRCVRGLHVASQGLEHGPCGGSGGGLPVVAFHLWKDGPRAKDLILVDEAMVSKALSSKGYSVPACQLPSRGREAQSVLRIVVRPSMTQENIDTIFETILNTVGVSTGGPSNIAANDLLNQSSNFDEMIV